MKYLDYDNDPKDTKLFEKDGYTVYKGAPNIGRLYLVRDGKVVAKNMNGDESIDFLKWIAKFEKNAQKQILALADRVQDLLNEKDEILAVLTRIAL